MTINQCTNCKKPFSTIKSGMIDFCSRKCKVEHEDKKLEIDENWMKKQTKMDIAAKRKADENDCRLPKKKLF